MTCTRCLSLSSNRSQIVHPDILMDFGKPCLLLVVGEAPSAEEDRLGRGFVGRAGNTLHKLLDEFGLVRGRDYGCANLVRCRPPENRKPTMEEVQNCRPHLEDTIANAKPRVLLAVGDSAASVFYGGGSLTERLAWAENLLYRPHSVEVHPALLAVLRDHDTRVVPALHTSPLAWNRNAPDGRKWSEVGREQVGVTERLLAN